jgi:hypothetical protein
MKNISKLALIALLGTSFAVAQNTPPGKQAPSSAKFFEDDFDDYDDEFDDYYDEDDYSENALTGSLFDVVYGLEEFAYENCNSKKHRGKFTSTAKVLRQLVKRMSKLPGVDESIQEDLEELNSTLKDLSSSLKDLCDPNEKESDDFEDDNDF